MMCSMEHQKLKRQISEELVEKIEWWYRHTIQWITIFMYTLFSRYVKYTSTMLLRWLYSPLMSSLKSILYFQAELGVLANMFLLFFYTSKILFDRSKPMDLISSQLTFIHIMMILSEGDNLLANILESLKFGNGIKCKTTFLHKQSDERPLYLHHLPPECVPGCHYQSQYLCVGKI